MKLLEAHYQHVTKGAESPSSLEADPKGKTVKSDRRYMVALGYKRPDVVAFDQMAAPEPSCLALLSSHECKIA